MKGLSRKLRKYVLTLSTVMMLVLLSAVSVVATGTSEDGNTTTGETEESIAEAAENEALALLDETYLKVTQNDWTYTGNEIKPEVELVVKDETTGKEIDVTNSFLISIQYSNNINAGTATVSAEISGYYVTDEDKFVGTESNSGEKRTDVIFSNSESREKTANFTIKAAELEQPLLAMWEGLVASLKTVAPNEWAAQYIDCALTTNEETSEEVVNLTIHRKWDDNTTAEPVYMQMGGIAVTFFKCLTEK